MDRDELQERIRARRSGDEPYRRGGAAPGYERFRPEPEDAAARRTGLADAPRQDLLTEAPAPPHRPSEQWPSSEMERADVTRDRDDWSPHRPVADSFPAGARLAPVEDYRAEAEPDYEEYEEPAYAEQYEEWEEEAQGRRPAGAGALAILGFLALGVLALLGGAVLAGVFGGDPQAGQLGATPSPSISASATSTPEPTPEPAASGDAGATALPRASGDPVVFPDGFTAEIQPCLPGSADDEDGCASNGAINGGSVVIWVGFQNGTEDDVISVAVREQGSSTPVGTGTIDLSRINCGAQCDGYTYFPVDGLDPGAYDVSVTRNGDPAGGTSFVVD